MMSSAVPRRVTHVCSISSSSFQYKNQEKEEKMMSSAVPRRVTVPKTCSNITYNGVGSKCCENNFKERKRPILKWPSGKLSSVGLRGDSICLNNIEEKEMDPSNNGVGIVRFFTGKVFLITGATGFLAKVLIEKILRTVPEVGKIYLLLRANDAEAAMQRIQTDIMNTELFHGLKQTYGRSHEKLILNKLVAVAGNLCDSNLGMEVNLADRITDEVDIIINSGGNTCFDERFDVSLGTNTLGPCRFLNFAKRCKKLKLFLHVSTAYVNGERHGIIMEKPFKLGDSIAREKASSHGSFSSFPLLDVEAEVKRALNARGGSADSIVSQKMKELGLERARTHGWHDTYTFTKAMGEMLIDNQREDVPVVILRPSVIESTYREPVKGWIEGIRMLDPMLVYYAKGALTGFPVDGNAAIDIVPVDMVVNAILAATVKHATMSKPGLAVYHVGSSVANPLLLRDFFGYFSEYFGSTPYIDHNKGPINVKKMKLFTTMDEFYAHVEAGVPTNGHATKGRLFMRKSRDIAKHLGKIYEPYMFYQGRFDNSNTEKLFREMSLEEKISFGFDVRSIDWKEYICNIHIPGVMRHSLKGRGM